MGRIVLVRRLAARDLRRRPVEAALLLLAIMGTTTTLTLGLALHGITDGPYERTREATFAPDVVASVAPVPDRDGGAPADRAGLETLAGAPGVVAQSGPYPVTWAALKAHGRTFPVRVDGRDRAPAAVDRPELTSGGWVRDGGVVVEAAFADAFGLHTGDAITLRALDLDLGRRPGEARRSRAFRVVGIAVTASAAPYPEVSCLAVCPGNAGLVWLARSDVRGLVPDDAALFVSYLKLADPAAAPAFVAEHLPPPGTAAAGGAAPVAEAPSLMAWQEIRAATANVVENQRRALLTGGWLLGVLAVASVAVLVGGRMADQIRRVGLLKAVGGTPGLVAAVLLAEYVAVAVLAAAAGLAVGWLAAPVLTDSGAGLLGSAGTPRLSVSALGVVTGVALAVAVAATAVPAARAARTSTVLALAGSARAPRRTGWLIALSAWVPVPLMLGLRVAARRPRRMALATVSIAVTVSGVVAALAAHADVTAGQVAQAAVADQLSGTGGSVVDASRTDRLNRVLLVITTMLVVLAALNALFITWATALDARRSSALSRALGATPHEITAGLSAAQVLPALVGAVLGIPGGIALVAAADPDPTTTLPPLWQLLAVVPGTVLAVAALTAIPARLGARRPVAEILASERA